MERPNQKGSNNFIVGMFVFVAFLVGAGFIVFMGGGTQLSGQIKVKTVFPDVRGLNVGAPVYLSGIQIGRVNGFQYATGQEMPGAENGIVTVFSIYKENLARIRTDSEASITTMGVLGDKVIVITPGTATNPAIEAGAMLPSHAQKELSEVFAKGGNMVDTLNKVASNLNELIEQLNDAGRVKQILKNLEKTSAQLDQVTQNINQGKGTIGALVSGGPKDDLGPAIKSLRHVLEKIEKGEGTLGALVNDPSLHEDLRILLGGAKRSQMVRFLLRQAISSGEDKVDPKKK